MSASLVGSEMCIRDRHDPLPGLECQPPCTQGLGQGSFAHLAHAARNLAPVSYTHLTLPTICSV
eukprot:6712177-Alexandrium_andersonii.AAC.1